MKPDLPKQVILSNEVLFQELDNESIMLNLRDEYYYSLDDVGTRLWQLLAEDGEVEQAIAQMLTEYDVDETRLRQDVAELLTLLTEAGIATVTG